MLSRRTSDNRTLGLEIHRKVPKITQETLIEKLGALKEIVTHARK